jgi:hypothetical protein
MKIETHLIQSHTPLFQWNDIRTDAQFYSELIEFTSDRRFLDFDYRHAWDFTFPFKLVKRLRRSRHLKEVARWIKLNLEAWPVAENYNNDSETILVQTTVLQLLRKSSTAIRIIKALKMLEEFSYKVFNLKQRWAQYCEARQQQAVDDNHFVDHFHDVVDFDVDQNPGDLIHGMGDYNRF